MNGIKSDECLRLDAEDKSGSLSLSTTSQEEIGVVRGISVICFTFSNVVR